MRAEIQLAQRQEDAGERKERLIRDEKGITILSLRRAKGEMEKATKQRNSQRPGDNSTACCHGVHTEVNRSSSKQVMLSANCLALCQGRVQPVYKVFTSERSL